jgi:hypothetical protein
MTAVFSGRRRVSVALQRRPDTYRIQQHIPDTYRINQHIPDTYRISQHIPGTYRISQHGPNPDRNINHLVCAVTLTGPLRDAETLTPSGPEARRPLEPHNFYPACTGRKNAFASWIETKAFFFSGLNRPGTPVEEVKAVKAADYFFFPSL